MADEANLSNWRTCPHSRWAFHNVRAIVPVADIANDPKDVAPLPARPIDLGTFSLDAGAMDLAAFHAATSTDALVVLLNGEIAYEAYFNGTTADTPHILMSATKAVVGLFAGVLHGRGLIDAEAAVSRYVPEVEGTAYAGATVRQLLDMRTGIKLDGAQAQAYANAMNWAPLAPGEPRIGFEAFLQWLEGPPALHGGPFSYISANFDLLGLVIERATGRRFADLFSELFWKPLGAERAGYITLDSDGAPRCTGGLCITARDFARIGRLILDHGRRNGDEIVPQAWLEDIFSNGDSKAWRTGEWGPAFSMIGGAMSYRAGWYVVEDEPRTMFAMGVHGQNLFIDPTRNLVVAKLSSQPTPLEQIVLTHQAVAEIRRTLLTA